MEANQDLPTEKLTKVENGKMQFIFCDSLEEKYKPACYLENSVFFENFNKTPRDYAKNINYCKQIENKVYRMSCVRLFAARAVRISRFTDIVKMCQQNTSSRDERIVCTGVFSLRIARSIDKTRTSVVYHGAVTDICKTLPIGESSKCIDLVYNKLLYLINENNFNL
jgi:hypothetical protein